MSDQKLLDELINTLNLEKLEENLFRGQSEQTAWGRSLAVKLLVKL